MAKRPGLAGRPRLDEQGATTVEYALILGFVAMMCVVAIMAMSQALTAPLQHVIDGLS